MCGRYTLIKLSSFLDYFSWIETPKLFPAARYNVAPSQSIPIVTREGRIDFVRWGLVPSWSRDGSITAGSRMINARAETLAEKPSFRRLLQKQRCLIPADGFYEWQKHSAAKVKQPFCFRLKGGRPFAFAGLFDRWRSPQGEELRTCTIITTSANQMLKSFHDRMPVILKDEDCRDWISSRELTGDETARMLCPYPAEEMTDYPVSNLVNSVKNDGPELMQPAELQPKLPPFQPSLFPDAS